MSYMQQALREWAWIVGAERLDQQWLLTDCDSWEPNPHYTGSDQGHPEDQCYDEDLSHDQTKNLSQDEIDYYLDKDLCAD